jgi:hypothetical protein
VRDAFSGHTVRTRAETGETDPLGSAQAHDTSTSTWVSLPVVRLTRTSRRGRQRAHHQMRVESKPAVEPRALPSCGTGVDRNSFWRPRRPHEDSLPRSLLLTDESSLCRIVQPRRRWSVGHFATRPPVVVIGGQTSKEPGLAASTVAAKIASGKWSRVPKRSTSGEAAYAGCDHPMPRGGVCGDAREVL